MMDTFKDLIEQHNVYRVIQEAIEAIDEVISISNNYKYGRAVNYKEEFIRSLDDWSRIRLVVRNFSVALNSCDKKLISTDWLEDGLNAINNIVDYTKKFRYSDIDKNKKYLILDSVNTNIMNDINKLLLVTTYLNSVKSEDNKKNIAHKDQLNKLNAMASELNTNISQLNTEIVHLRERTYRDYDELSKEFIKDKERLDKIIFNYESEIEHNKVSLLKNFDIELKKIEFKKEEIDIEIKNKLANIADESDVLIDEYRQKFCDYEKQVVDIVGTINNNMFSHKYKEVANNAREWALIWHIVTIVFIAIFAGSALLTFNMMLTAQKEGNIVILLSRIFSTLAIAMGAAYTAQLANRKEKIERHARKIEMELVAIEPFIQSLDEERKHSIKEELARKIFGNPDIMDNIDGKTKDDIDCVSIEKLTKLMATFMKNYK